jgi:hypothetical protein
MSQMFNPQALREKALELADEAAHEADYHRRRQLEEAAMAYWRRARREGRGEGGCGLATLKRAENSKPMN